MIKMPKSLSARQTNEFNLTFKAEVKSIELDALLLQAGLSQANYALTDEIEALILNTSEDSEYLKVKAGIFYKGIVAGCACADDPTPVNEITEYCEVVFAIDKTNTITKIYLINE